jgi:diguanylate cyclase (GGDEF)-like protein
VIVTVLVTLTAATSEVSATSEMMLFLLPAVFGACFLPMALSLCALGLCSAAYGWLVSRQLSVENGLIWWSSATIVLASATTTVAVLRRELTATLRELGGLARCDPLTGLLNRRSFDELLVHELERCERSSQTCALLMCDLDHFKQINDTHGHTVGDAVLRRVSADLLAGVRAIDRVLRVGGEEIAVLLVDCPGELAAVVAERLRRSVAHSRTGQPDVTISIGVADSAHAVSPDDLVGQADRALYTAKRSGRNRVCQASDLPSGPLQLAA